jgi:hypothetical protein
MIIGIAGDIGAGKTLVATKILLEEYLAYPDKKVFANMQRLKHIPYEYLSFDRCVKMAMTDEELKSAILLVDEAHVWFDSRTSISKLNRIFSYFLLQTGKMDITLIYTTQHFGQVDRRLRERTDLSIIVERNGDLHTCHGEDLSRGKKFKFLIHGPDVYEFYDTKEVVKQR